MHGDRVKSYYKRNDLRLRSGVVTHTGDGGIGIPYAPIAMCIIRCKCYLIHKPPFRP